MSCGLPLRVLITGRPRRADCVWGQPVLRFLRVLITGRPRRADCVWGQPIQCSASDVGPGLVRQSVECATTILYVVIGEVYSLITYLGFVMLLAVAISILIVIIFRFTRPTMERPVKGSICPGTE
ncbi:hypothetical protein T265_12109 [Opisthorchis viverrini]|uniref:Uncharacterized protein n=1 Tax=Opisthorchis viverrini TaxID=6198 RepID=A0A074Z6M0_OPIVI|nr:hypothetical protein T265_12109 [Opisthorchis viverrini]KER18895.1 hypothetical protein T265_12109 [Opisthorchis viverrini]